MQVVVQVKLLPDEGAGVALASTLAACNQAADWVSAHAYHTGLRGRKLRAAVYQQVKQDFGLSAQPAQLAIKKAADAYTTLKALCDNGILRRRRKAKALSKPVGFRETAAQPFDVRCLSWRHDARTVSIWTVHGRMTIPFTGHTGQLKTAGRRGEDRRIRSGVP